MFLWKIQNFPVPKNFAKLFFRDVHQFFVIA